MPAKMCQNTSLFRPTMRRPALVMRRPPVLEPFPAGGIALTIFPSGHNIGLFRFIDFGQSCPHHVSSTRYVDFYYKSRDKAAGIYICILCISPEITPCFLKLLSIPNLQTTNQHCGGESCCLFHINGLWQQSFLPISI